MDDELQHVEQRALVAGLSEVCRGLSADNRHTGPKSFPKWAKERLWVRQKGGGQTQFNLWPVQRQYLAAKHRARRAGKQPRFLLLKYRRGGFTTLEQALSYRYTRDNPDTSALTLAHTEGDTKKIFRIARLFHERDIDGLPLKGAGSAFALEYATNGSVFQLGTAGGKGPGVGATIQRVHGSEVSRWCVGPKQIEKQEEVLSGLEEAASHGEIVLETTAHGIEHFCNLYRGAKAGTNDWVPLFLRWFDDRNNVDPVNDEIVTEIRDTLSDEEITLVARFGLVWGQIAWRRRAVRRLRALFVQEYPEDDDSCFLTSGVRFFDTNITARLLQTVEDRPGKHVAGGLAHEWVPKRAGRRYVIGVDTSEGVEGGDPCGLGVLDFASGEQVAGVHGLFRPKRLAELVFEYYRKYDRPLIGVERQNHGHAVLEAMDNLPYDPEDIFRNKPGSVGWSTDVATRPVMLDELAEAVHEGLIKIHDRTFVSELTTFGLQGTKWEADPGSNDDSVFKWGIAWQMRKFVSQREPDEVYSTPGAR